MQIMLAVLILAFVSIAVFAVGPLTFYPTLRSVTSSSSGAEVLGAGLTTDQINANVSGTAAVANAANLKTVSVIDYGAVPNSATDQYAAFASAIRAVITPGSAVYGATILVPSGNYILSTAPTWGSSSIHWSFANHVTFSGAGGVNWPHAYTNISTLAATGDFIQFSDSVVSPPYGGPSAFTSEVFQPSGVTGNYMGGYFGASSASAANTPTYGGIWGVNALVEAKPGMAGGAIAAEFDVNSNSTAASNTIGVLVQGTGTQNSTAAIMTGRADSSLWHYGLVLENVQFGIVMKPTTIGLSIGNPVGGQAQNGLQAITVQQMANTAGSDIIYANRLTDTVPVGSFLRLTNAANNTNLFQVDVSGNLYANRLASIGGDAPSLTHCGTSPSMAAHSGTNVGQFTLGTGMPTSCTLTFSVAFSNSAFCTVTPASAYTGTYYISASLASGFTVTLGTGTNSVAFNYTCLGN